ncbi:MAG: single-stranded DNA-binding protein [Chloroflexota bacterium]|nr:single-stranded DNA-binding protein [Chloroflexota bacterium]
MNNMDNTTDKLQVSIRGFVAVQPILKQRQNMSILKVGVQLQPNKRDYYDVCVFGPKAYWITRHVDRGMIVELDGNLDFSVRQGKRGAVSPKMKVYTNDVALADRGQKHFASVSLEGEVGTQPYFSRTVNETPVSSFEMKVNRKSKSGRERMLTLNIGAFGDLATTCQAYLYREGRASVEGSLRLGIYTGGDNLLKASLDIQARAVRPRAAITQVGADAVLNQAA